MAPPKYETARPEYEMARPEYETARPEYETARPEYEMARPKYEKRARVELWQCSPPIVTGNDAYIATGCIRSSTQHCYMHRNGKKFLVV